jgi:queuine tRNA-ribosyltransferase
LSLTIEARFYVILPRNKQMFEFKILKKSKKSKARLGFIKTSYGIVETPCLVPVATQAVVKTLTNEQVLETKTQILIANTFHLHLRPGEEIIQKAGGLHNFMNWKKPLMTDSGGFQAFSLGFGKDLGMGKILKQKTNFKIREGQQPKLLKITEEGILFRSYLDGKEIFLGPKESIKIQEKLGADIIFAFDECTSPVADYKYTKKSLLKTHRWAEICLKVKESCLSQDCLLSRSMLNRRLQQGESSFGCEGRVGRQNQQALFGIIQGGKYKDLRIESAKFIGNLPFDGFGIGGEFGDDKKLMLQMINWVIKELPEKKPRHLLGIGYLKDIPKIIKAGVDTFDCIVPTHYARRGIAFTSGGKIDFLTPSLLKDKNPIDKKCGCFVCQNYRRNYISHLFRAGEITGMNLLTFHNLYFFNSFIEKIRESIKEGKV